MRVSTLEHLRSEFATPCPTLSAVRERYFPHIGSDRRLRELINKGQIDLKLSKLHNSAKAQHVVYLTNLAAYIDRQAESANQPA
ncbi:pyocin activator PrtN family protein [Pseudomonas putida]|nr:pyocin activator PrtN family protein [Pseudomonas putida]MCI1036902.1 pyocin activator PrtN family protein [Pseudomonas putida]